MLSMIQKVLTAYLKLREALSLIVTSRKRDHCGHQSVSQQLQTPSSRLRSTCERVMG